MIQTAKLLNKCPGCTTYPHCSRQKKTGRQLCGPCAKTLHSPTETPKAIREAGKGKEFCITRACPNRVSMRKRSTTKGEVEMRPRAYCKPCEAARYYTGEVKARNRIVQNARYQLIKLNPEAMEKRRKAQRYRDQRRRKQQKQNWLAIHEQMPSLKHVPQSTSKFGLKVYAEVLKALSQHNIKFKGEFNYLEHDFYQKAPGSKECGLRADLLVEIQREGREKPQTIIIEAQGAQHRPLLQQHLANIEKQISGKYDDLAGSDKALFLNALQGQNAKQLQQDLAKLLMSVSQGFVHIIVYDENSVETAIADALNNNNNMGVYYPSEIGVDTNAIIKQFVDQLLSREGSWRQPGSTCAHFELSRVFLMMCKDPTLEMFDGDLDDDEERDMGDISTIDDQDNDRARILIWLEKIDPRFLDSKPVENLKIDFTQGYACSVAAQETATTSPGSPTPKIMNKRARSDDPVLEDQPPAPKKKKKN